MVDLHDDGPKIRAVDTGGSWSQLSFPVSQFLPGRGTICHIPLDSDNIHVHLGLRLTSIPRSTASRGEVK